MRSGIRIKAKYDKDFKEVVKILSKEKGWANIPKYLPVIFLDLINDTIIVTKKLNKLL